MALGVEPKMMLTGKGLGSVSITSPALKSAKVNGELQLVWRMLVGSFFVL